MRTLNVRLAAILLVVFVVACVGIHFLHRFQVRRNAYVFLDESTRAQERATRAADDGDLRQQLEYRQEARKNLGWYVKLVPDDIESFERYAIMTADLSREGPSATMRMKSEAYGLMEMVLRKDPGLPNVRRRLVEMAMAHGRVQDAKEHLTAFLIKQSPDSPELWDLLGQCNVQMGDYAEAIKNFKEAITLGPDQVEVYKRLANVLRRNIATSKSINEANHWMEKLVEVNPRSVQAHCLRGTYLREINDLDGAISEVQNALGLGPDNRDSLLLASQCYLSKGDIEKARDYASQGIKKYPKHIDMYVAMAEVELRAGNRDKAIDIFEDGLKNNQRSPRLLWSMTNLLIDVNRLKEADKIITELSETEYAKQLIEYLRARMSMARGEWLAARQKFESIRGFFTVWPEMLKQLEVWTAQCYAQLGNREQQLEAYRRALKIDSNFGPARAGLTEAMMSGGDVKGAIGEYSQLLKSGRIRPTALLPLAKMMIVENIQRESKNRNWAAVEKVLNQAEEYLPDAYQIQVLRAEILLAKERPADAEKLLIETRRKHPDKNDLLLSLIALAEKQRDWPKAESLLAEYSKSAGDSVEYRLAQSRYLVRKHGAEAADRLDKLAENIDRFSDADKMQLWSGLFNAAVQSGNTKQAIKLGGRIAEKNPNNVQVRYALFEQAMKNNDDEGMDKALAEIERVAGQGAFWHYGKAVRLSMRAKNDKDANSTLVQALDHLAHAQELQKTWSKVPLLIGGIYDQQGNIDEALKYYLNAIEMGERNPNAIRRAVQILFQKQKYTDADRLLQQMENQRVQFTFDMNKAAAEIALRKGDLKRTLELTRNAVAGESKNPIEHVWLGQMLSLLGRRAKGGGNVQESQTLFDDAEKALRRAIELGPKVPATWAALIQFFAMSNRNDEAEKALADAEKNISAKEAPLAIAQCYEAMNKTEAATEKYEAALAASPNNSAIVRAVADFYYRTGNPALAEPLLHRILGGKMEVKPEETAWARRQLAVMVAARGGYENLQKARELVEKNLAIKDASVIDQRLMVSLDASDPSRSRRDAAIKQLEAMQGEESASPEDRLQLAQMYMATGAWTKASAILRGLAASNSDEPKYLIAYISALLNHGETSNVELWLDRLESNFPNSVMVLGLRAEYLAVKGESEKAIQLLESFVDDPKVQQADRRMRARFAAEKFEQLAGKMTKKERLPARQKFIEQAEIFLKRFVDQDPRLEPLLGTFFARHGRADDALDVLDRVWKETSVHSLAPLCSMVLHTRKISKQQIRRLDGIIQSALTYLDRPLQLLIVEADLATIEARYGDAENCYREILKKDGKNVIVMNNLAVLLALQGIKGQESLELINKAVEISGPVATMLDSRASVYTAIGEYEKALADIGIALEDAESPVRLFHQAVAYDRSGQSSLAAEAMKKALEKGLTAEILQSLEAKDFEKLSRLAK